MYISRHIEAVLKTAIKEKGVLCITGARQVGKSTTLAEMFPSHRQVTLDDSRLLRVALEEPEAFFEQCPPPIFIDEIQYAPSLFPYIKMYVDKTGERGSFILSGSQRYEMMANVTESLAGRINLIDLHGLSLREIYDDACHEPFVPTKEYLKKRMPKPISYSEVWNNIWRGSFPEIIAQGTDWARFYSSYVRTYLDRDVSKLGQVGNLLKFEKFMIAIAARTAQLLNIADIAKDTKISTQTAERWLSILLASNIVYILNPYHNNISKRLIKRPKIYFLDTGLLSYLIGWDNPNVLQNGSMSGAIFETFVLSEILKSWTNTSGITPNRDFYFFRDKDGNEIDLLLKRGDVMHPVEIKKHVACDKSDIVAFGHLDKMPNIQRGDGCVVCMAGDVLPITARDKAVGLRFV